jgi:hypothetical protein
VLTTDWAPEMIMKDSKGHRIRYNQCVDWFSFGRLCQGGSAEATVAV